MYAYYIKSFKSLSEYQELYSFMQSEHNSILSLKCSYHSACVIRKPVINCLASCYWFNSFYMYFRLRNT